jgi:hypothetical protein
MSHYLGRQYTFGDMGITYKPPQGSMFIASIFKKRNFAFDKKNYCRFKMFKKRQNNSKNGAKLRISYPKFFINSVNVPYDLWRAMNVWLCPNR